MTLITLLYSLFPAYVLSSRGFLAKTIGLYHRPIFLYLYLCGNVSGFIAVEQSASLRFEFRLVAVQLTTVDKAWLECLGFIYNRVIASLLYVQIPSLNMSNVLLAHLKLFCYITLLLLQNFVRYLIVVLRIWITTYHQKIRHFANTQIGNCQP
jgi:hypothetical protein